MNNPHKCGHKRLTFGEGGYKLFCLDCPRKWIAFVSESAFEDIFKSFSEQLMSGARPVGDTDALQDGMVEGIVWAPQPPDVQLPIKRKD